MVFIYLPFGGWFAGWLSSPNQLFASRRRLALKISEEEVMDIGDDGANE